ncbi:AAA family ATPase, partial [candidate division WWE3 bacterium RBG_19FT_COMBO_34_6]
KIRPNTLDEFVGQKHLVAKDKPLYNAIENKNIFSMIFWGPPGVGKTTLAKIYANSLNANFVEMSAVSAGKSDIKGIIENIKPNDNPTIIFLDEIHRFNKAQQDFLLPYVEKGIITLIGATTENPSFEVISPLLSRCKVFVLYELNDEEMRIIIKRSLLVLKYKKELDEDTNIWLINMANGDARAAISMLENTFNLYRTITLKTLTETLQNKFLRYDKQGEEHYNVISAFIKSMRASDVDAALYYLARMVDSGEDPLFIARRMVVFASEDVASPTALVVANSVFQACQQIGYPECQENLAAGTVYLANSVKERFAYDAYMSALQDVKLHGNLPIPLKIRNAPTKLMKDLGYSKDYEMYDKSSLLPDKIKTKKYYKKPRLK